MGMVVGLGLCVGLWVDGVELVQAEGMDGDGFEKSKTSVCRIAATTRRLEAHALFFGVDWVAIWRFWRQDVSVTTLD